MSNKIVTVQLIIDPVEYGEENTDRAALEIAEAIMKGDADVGEYNVTSSRPA